MTLHAPFWPMFIAVASICFTPGPNNLILAALGSQRAFRRARTFIAGALSGANFVFVTVALVLGHFFSLFPLIQPIFGLTGGTILLYFAIKIVFSDPHGETRLPTSVKVAFMIQFFNVKVWIGAFSFSSAFLHASAFGEGALDFLVIFALQVFLGGLSMLTWLGIGTVSASILKSRAQLKLFNIVLGISLGIVALFILRESLAFF